MSQAQATHPEELEISDIEISDETRLIWVKVQWAVEHLWERNSKLHDMGAMAQSFGKHGFQELPKWDETLGAIKAGNGRVECLAAMERQGQELVRGLAIQKGTGAWVMPLLVGVNARTKLLAESYGIDSNNLTVMGGNFTALDASRMHDPEIYLALLKDLEGSDDLPVTVDADDLALLIMQLTNTDDLDESDDIPTENKSIDEEMLSETNCICPSCGFAWKNSEVKTK